MDANFGGLPPDFGKDIYGEWQIIVPRPAKKRPVPAEESL